MILITIFADLSHPVEQRIRNAQVIGSSPIVGSQTGSREPVFFSPRAADVLSFRALSAILFP